MTKIEVIRLQRKMNNGGTWLVLATRSDGSSFYCGDDKQTEKGSKRMFTMRARQFNLTIFGNEAS